MNSRFWCRTLEHGQEEIFGFRVGNCTSYFALLTTDAALRMHKDCLHSVSLLSQGIFDLENRKNVKNKFVLLPLLSLLTKTISHTLVNNVICSQGANYPQSSPTKTTLSITAPLIFLILSKNSRLYSYSQLD